MNEYGLTPNGPNIKRLDVILDEMHTDLSKRWGVNTRQNPESFINHLLTDVADQIAQLWELGEDVYHSQYPSSAEGRSLDNAAQYGGSTREAAAKSYYPIHCTGRDGTKLAAGTMISSTMNPTTQLTITDTREITRSAFNKAAIKISSLGTGDVYTVAINGAVYSYAPTDPGTVAILKGMAEAIKDEDFTVTVDEENELLRIEAKDITSTNVLVLSENLTTDTVTTIITFGTVETGDILLPEGVITNIVKADAGLLSVANLCTYIAGRDEETDTEFRQSYADKIFNRSSMMLESIRSAILNNVQGVTSVAPYENPTHEWDEYGGRRTVSRSLWTVEIPQKLPSKSSRKRLVASIPTEIPPLFWPGPTMRILQSGFPDRRPSTPGSTWASRSVRLRPSRRTMWICCGRLFWRI